MDRFNANAFQDASDEEYTPLSNGLHEVKIVTAEDKPNQAGTGRYVLIEFKVLDGEEAGKRVREYCTHKHPNPKAVSAGLGRLKRIMLSAGVEEIEDETDLLGLKLCIETEIEEPEEGSSYKPQARVKKYYPLMDADKGDDSVDEETPF